MKKVILLLLFPLALNAQKNYPQLLDEYTQAEFKVKEFNGTVLVMQKGKAIYKKSYGMADREWNIANTNETKYRIGSVTKQFTAACILQLAEQGKLGLDDKLSKYIPDYPKGDSITIHMLLNHTSGIKNYTDLPVFWPKALTTNKIISAVSVKKMTTSYMNNYGYGIGSDSLKTHPRIAHSGGIPGFVSYLAFFPDDDICVAVISNNSGSSSGLGVALASIMYDLHVQKPYTTKEVKIDTTILDKYLGKYMATGPIELIKKNGKLYRHRDGSPDIQLKAESNTRFFYANNSERFIEFKIDKAGKVTKAWFIGNADKIEMKRL